MCPIIRLPYIVMNMNYVTTEVIFVLKFCIPRDCLKIYKNRTRS